MIMKPDDAARTDTMHIALTNASHDLYGISDDFATWAKKAARGLLTRLTDAGVPEDRAEMVLSELRTELNVASRALRVASQEVHAVTDAIDNVCATMTEATRRPVSSIPTGF